MVDGSVALNGSGNQAVWIHVHLHSQDINGNYSTYYGEVRYYGNGWGSYTGNNQYWSANFGGHAYSGSWTIPYANRNDSYTVLGAWYFNHGHNADGTRPAWNASATIDSDHTSIGDGTVTVTEPASPTIPRASQPSFPGGAGLTTGVAATINTNWASSGFTHNASWSFGALSGQTAGFSASTGIGASFTFTPPESMLAQIPNAAVGSGTLYLDTYSGGTYIGGKSVGFTVTAAGTVKPTISSITIVEQNATVASQVGAYVQSLSILRGTVNAAGIQGSTIASRSWSMNGMSVASGADITPSGSGTVAIAGAATDSRGRVGTYASNITVLPYTAPKINSAQVRRALSSGVPDDNGTYLRLDLNALVQSLIVGTEKNTLTIKVFTRLYGTTPWTARNVILHSATSYNTNVLVTGGAIFPVNQSFDVKIEVTDKFNTANPALSQTVISTAAIFMHWSQTGVGIGKYHTQGVLDVAGDIYQSNNLVIDASDAATTAEILTGTNNVKYVTPLGLKESSQNIQRALLDPTYIGPGPAKVSFLPSGSLSSVAYQWLGTWTPWGNRVVNMIMVDGTWMIQGHNSEEGYGGKIDLPLLNGNMTYNLKAVTAFDRFPTAKAQKLVSGIVVLSGLVGYGTSTAGTPIAVLPPGYRPDYRLVIPVNNADTAKSIRIDTDGTISPEASNWVANSYVSLDGIAFPAAGVATWTAVGSGGSSFANSWVDYGGGVYGVPRFWKDPYGFVWFGGLIKNGSTTAEIVMINMPTTHRQHLESHNKTVSNSAFGFTSGKPGSGLHWKSGTTGNGFLSLDGIVHVTQEAVDNNPWHYPVGFSNAWQRYSTSFPRPGFLRRADGLGMAMGLLGTGTINTKMSMVPSHIMPYHTQLILYSVSAAAFNRVDIWGLQNSSMDERGAIRPNTGSSTWVSWDNQMWMVGD